MPSPCEECGKEFGTARQLRSHREVHQLSAELRLCGALPASFEQQSHAISVPSALDLLATASLRRRRSASSDSQSDAPRSSARPTQSRRPADAHDGDSVSDSFSSLERGRSAEVEAYVSDEARLAPAHLYHLAALHLVVCIRCKIALGPRHAASHARHEHNCETDRLQRVLNSLDLVNPTAADIVPLPASTPHLQRAPPHAGRPPSFIISRNPLVYAPIDQQLHPSTDTDHQNIIGSDMKSTTRTRDGDEGSGAVARMKALHTLLIRPAKPALASSAANRLSVIARRAVALRPRRDFAAELEVGMIRNAHIHETEEFLVTLLQLRLIKDLDRDDGRVRDGAV
ncbi:hypothetical protein U1Q18_044803 [Sarracenia purpurea var. burkii]